MTTHISADAQNRKFTIDYKTPFNKNKKDAHAIIIPFANLENAKKGEYRKSPFFHSLNEIWSNKQTKKSTLEQNSIKIKEFEIDIDIPARWSEREIFIHFGAVESPIFLWTNGEYVGNSLGSKSPIEFNISKFIKPDKNNLTVEVFDCNIFGTKNDIYLYSTPKTYIQDYAVNGSLKSNNSIGVLDLKIFLTQKSKNDNTKVSVSLFDDKEVVFQNHICTKEKQLYKTQKEIQLQKEIEEIKPWSAENPNLYTLIIKTINKKGNITEILSSKIGFRNIEIINNQLLVNGETILIKEVNHIENDKKNRENFSEEIMLKDIALLKQNNINAIRHYPQSSKWFELCDKYGIYLIGEENSVLNKTDFPKHYLEKDSNRNKTYLDQTKRMIMHHRNHPSIIVWSLEDETNDSLYFPTILNWIKTTDRFRPIISKRKLSLILNKNIYNTTKSPSLKNFTKHNRIDYKCHSLRKIKKMYQNFAFSCYDRHNDPRSSVKIEVINKHFFTQFSPYELKWELLENGEVKKIGFQEKFALKPQDTTIIEIPINYQNWQNENEYFLNLSVINRFDHPFIDRNSVVAEEQIELQNGKYSIVKKNQFEDLILRENRNKIVVENGKLIVEFDKERGALEKYSFLGEMIISSDIKANFWQDRTNGNIPKRSEIWKNISKKIELKKITHKRIKSDELRIETLFSFLEIEAELCIEYEIFGNGVVRIFETLIPKKEKTVLQSHIRDSRYGKSFYFSEKENCVLKTEIKEESIFDNISVLINFRLSKSGNKSVLWSSKTGDLNCVHLELLHDSTLLFLVGGADAIPFDYKFETGKWYGLQLNYNGANSEIEMLLTIEADKIIYEKIKLNKKTKIDFSGFSYIGGYSDGTYSFKGEIRNFLVHAKNSSDINYREVIDLNFKNEIAGKIEDISGNDYHAIIEHPENQHQEPPTFGTSLEISKKYSNIEYYGRDSENNHISCNNSTSLRKHKSKINIKPDNQENGYKTDVRYLSLTNSSGKGILFTGTPLFSFSAFHNANSKENEKINLNIDYNMFGLKRENRIKKEPQKKHQTPFGYYRYSYCVIPFDKRTDNEYDLYIEWKENRKESSKNPCGLKAKY